ncbi:Cytoplasm protein [Mycena sanguinolenta]|uniref:Cytoplasm protein n=1 Tax=Mycena sanguinolenta TaxID=230812 RepID=A0A8H6ZCH8_9AGAR|nr:Cytoplasm protein [Mycena sanguinolenta]
MTSYLRSWLTGAPVAAAPDVPQVLKVSPPASDDEGEGTETEDNSIPAFPALNSAQRAAPSKPPRILSDSALMPPPPVPSLATRTPGVATKSSTAGSSLLVPTTTKPPKPSKKREKVALTPGHSPLDWAALKSSGADLRGVDTLMRIPPSVLKQHRSKDDAWTAINGKVYNITAYLPFHPGGERELMRVAGRDGTHLFTSTHAWVNADFMLDTCLVGFLIPEPSTDSS